MLDNFMELYIEAIEKASTVFESLYDALKRIVYYDITDSYEVREKRHSAYRPVPLYTLFYKKPRQPYTRRIPVHTKYYIHI